MLSDLPSNPNKNDTPRPSAAIPGWLPLAILAVTIAILFYRLLIGQVLFWGLPSLQFEPWRAFAISELGAGRMPLWNPFNGAGAPLFANYQSALLYPPNMLALLIPGAQALGWLGMIHLIWAGIGMWLYAREIRLSPLAGGIAALAYALNSAVVARLGTPPMVAAASWLPWLIFLIERLIARPRLREAALLTVISAMQLLAGHAQWTFYSLALAAAYTLYRVAIVGRARLQSCLWIAGAVALGFGIAAIQLLPTAELQRQSQRSAGVDTDFALNFSYEWPLLITQFNPSFFGNPGDGSYLIGGEYFETTSYIEILPVALAVLVVGHMALNWRRSATRLPDAPLGLITFFAVVTLVAFLLALGRNSALFMFLFQHVPTFNLFQAPARWLLLATFSLSVLAGLGAQLWKPDRRARQRARLGFVGALGIALIAVILSALFPDRGIARGLIVLGVQLAVVALIFILQPNPIHAGRLWQSWAVGVLIFVAADLAWANASSNPTTAPSFYDPRPVQSPARTFQPDATLNKIEFGQFLVLKDYRVAAQHLTDYRSAGLPNMNLLDRQPSFNTFEPLRPDGIDQFTKLLDQELAQQAAPNLRTAAAVGQQSDPEPSRAWLVSSATATHDPFSAMHDPTWNPMQRAFIEGENLPDLNGSQSGSAQITHETPLEIDLSTDSSGATALIVADTWYPGWTATIDGIPTSIFRANGAFRAVMLPTGKHSVIMRYTPDSLRSGALISGLALLIWGALVGYSNS